MRIHVTRPIPAAALELLRRQGAEVTVGEGPEPPPRSALLAAVAGVEGLLTLLTERVDAELLQAAPSLRVVSQMAVGYDNVDVAEATRRRVLVCHTPGVLTETVADFTWALLLALARRVVEGDRFLREGRFRAWDPMLLLGPDVHGSTLGLIGFGRIGQAVARRAAGFSMRVLFYDPTHPEDEHWAGGQLCHRSELEPLLRQADFVSLHAPLTRETRHLIGARELALMKPTACLINTSRGPLVDERALVEALRRGHPAGAALDVFEDEPRLAPGLAELPNTVLVPHMASASRQTRERMALLAAENLLTALSGRLPEHAVNPEAWI